MDKLSENKNFTRIKNASAAVQIRRMLPADVPFVAQIEAACFSEPWCEKGFLDALAQPDVIFVTAVDAQDIPVGYCGMYVSADEGEITNVAVREELRGQGIAGAILEEVLTLARQQGISRIFLEVRQSNRPALALYEKFGFSSCGIRKNFYRKPTEDAAVMCLEAETPGS